MATQSQTIKQGQPGQSANANNLSLPLQILPASSQGISEAATIRRPVIHTPRSRRTHVSVRQPPVSKNLRWTASTVHSLLSSHPASIQDANVIAARVATLASRAAATDCHSKADDKSKADSSSGNAAASKRNGDSKDLPKDKRKGKKKSDVPSSPVHTAGAEAWSCTSAVERNARRRVYDTLKVMAAAGCVLKQGKHLSWIGVDHLLKPFSHPPLCPSAVHPGVAVCFKRHSIAQKKRILADLQYRVRAYSQLHHRRSRTVDPFSPSVAEDRSAESTAARNALSKPGVGNKRRRTQAPPPRLEFPFLLIRAHDPEVVCSPDQKHIQVSTCHSSLKVYSETDIVCLLAECRPSASKKLKKVPLVEDKPSKPAESLVCTHSAPLKVESRTRANVKSATAKRRQRAIDSAGPLKRAKVSCSSRDKNMKCNSSKTENEKPESSNAAIVTDEQRAKASCAGGDKAPKYQSERAFQAFEETSDECDQAFGRAIAEEDYDISQIVERELDLPTLGDEDLDVDVLCPLGSNTDNCDDAGNDILGWIKDHTEETFGIAQHSDVHPYHVGTAHKDAK